MENLSLQPAENWLRAVNFATMQQNVLGLFSAIQQRWIDAGHFQQVMLGILWNLRRLLEEGDVRRELCLRV